MTVTPKSPSMPAHDLAGVDLMLSQDERDIRQASSRRSTPPRAHSHFGQRARSWAVTLFPNQQRP